MASGSRQKRIEKRDRKKLVESLINEPPAQNISRDDLAHCINLNNHCIFCLDDHTSIHFELENWKNSNNLQDLTNIWRCIQPNWKDNIIPDYAFFNRWSEPSKIPAMCTPCQDQVSKVAEHLRKISTLKLELEELEKESKRLGLELRRKAMDSPETPPNLRTYASRYKTLLVDLVREKGSQKVLSNTIAFLNQLRGCAIDISESEPQEVSESPTQITMSSSLATPNTVYSRPSSTSKTSNSSPANSFTINNSSTENRFLNKLKNCSVDLSRDNLSLSILAPAPEEINDIKTDKCLTSPSLLTSRKTINIRILTSSSDAAVSENEDVVKAEFGTELDVENEEEIYHVMNNDSCECDPPSSPEDEEDKKPETEDCAQNEVIGPTQICEVCTEEIHFKDIYNHIHSHVGDFAYKCPNPRCNYTFLTQYSVAFLKHRLNDRTCWNAGAANKGFQNVCEQCSKSNFPGTLQFGLHLKTHEITSEKNFICPLKPCQEGFTLRQSLEYHLHTSHDPELIRKSQEESDKNVKVTLTPEEMAIVHRIENELINKRHQCFSCDKSFKYAVNLRQHEKTHLPGMLRKKKRKYKCSFCKKSFARSSLWLHEKRHRGEHVCDICGKRYSLPCLLRDHRTIHTGERPHICHICGQRFRRSKTLSQHMKCKFVHMDKEKDSLQYPCQICGKVFRFSYTLKKHMLGYHEKGDEKAKERKSRIPFKRGSKTGRRRRKCSSCEKSFVNPFFLKLHVKYHHEGLEGDYVCDICGKRFVQSGGLKQHKLIHTGERPFQCHICGQAFRASSALKKHLRSKSVHKQIVEESTSAPHEEN